MIFQAFCDDDAHFALDNRPAWLAFLGTVRGSELTVTVEKKSRKRSVVQNAWLWGVAYPLIAESIGYDHHEHEHLHYDLLAVRFGTKAVTPLVDGAPPRIVPKQTSAGLTTKEFSEYMEWLVRFAAEKFSVVLPLPDEKREAA